MNLYDLSIGEDEMNQFLSIALKTHFESLKVGGKGENYWQCYQAFLRIRCLRLPMEKIWSVWLTTSVGLRRWMKYVWR